MVRLAALLALLGMLIAFVIAVGAALVILDADEASDLVATWLDVARLFVRPFRGLFDPENADVRVGVNWGIGAVAYVVAGLVLARLVRTVAARR